MRDTGIAAVEREALQSQIERLSRSNILHGSESLCKLLKYLGKQCLDAPGTAAKEYQIATEVFGRPAEFDSRVDSTVRVQTGRLRSKLAEYYTGDGSTDAMVVEIPKGSYLLTYRMRPSLDAPKAAPAEPVLVAAPIAPRSYPISWLALAMVGCALLAAGVVIGANRYFKPRGAADEQSGPALRTFWGPFASGPEAPLVIYSNAEFVGRPETGLRYFDPTQDAGKPVMDHYTGVGEVMAVHELDRVFGGLGREIRVKRGRLLTWDDAKASDLIFIGSPSENLSLREVRGTQDFTFGRKTDGPRQGDLTIFNLHPAPAEEAYYLASEGPMTEDYALVSQTTGLNASRRVVVLAGITTLGTQAAVEFVCHSGRLEELLTKMGPQARTQVPPFEALLRVRVSGGVPVQSELLALHVHAPPADGGSLHPAPLQ